MAFSLSTVQRFGYDLERGRLDKTHHPFCTKFSIGDVRITTRVRENDIGRRAVLHAARGRPRALRAGRRRRARGHAARLRHVRGRAREPVAPVGERGRAQPRLLGALLSAAPHSLSRTASRACRSKPSIARSTRCERSLIRTDADEVTYNLHVMMRFDLELRLLEGRLAVKDLPEAWRARFKADFGIAPPDDRDGCLQDVHWYGGIGRRRLPGLHDRQYPRRAVLCRRARSPSRRFRPRWRGASSPRCAPGCASTSTATDASSLPDELVRARDWRTNDASRLTSPICAASTASSTGSDRQGSAVTRCLP